MALVPIVGESERLSGRCGSLHLHHRCQRQEHTSGCHLVVTGEGRAIRWGVVEIGCFDPYCTRGPDHELPHRNGRGTSWWPGEVIDDELALFELEEV